MKNNKLDRRKKYTKMIIEDTFIEFYNTQSLNDISVKDICEKADINRSTFYSHYLDKFDVLEKIKENLFNDFKEILVNKGDQIANIAKEVINLIYDNKKVCYSLFKDFRDMEFMKEIVELGKKSFDKWKLDSTQFNYDLYTYIAAGTVGLIVKWINKGMKESIDSLVKKIDNFAQILVKA